jgi:hypothetical protein
MEQEFRTAIGNHYSAIWCGSDAEIAECVKDIEVLIEKYGKEAYDKATKAYSDEINKIGKN